MPRRLVKNLSQGMIPVNELILEQGSTRRSLEILAPQTREPERCVGVGFSPLARAPGRIQTSKFFVRFSPSATINRHAVPSATFVEDFSRRHGGAGMLIAESDVTMGEIANGPGPAPSPAAWPRTASMRFPKAGRSRNSGCQAARPACPPASLRPSVDRQMQTPGRAVRCRPPRHRRPDASDPAGATIRLHESPNPSRYGVIDTEGLVVRWSRTMMSDARVRICPNTIIMASVGETRGAFRIRREAPLQIRPRL
jgi:hypothetical protein